jgi:hypothetical protein
MTQEELELLKELKEAIKELTKELWDLRGPLELLTHTIKEASTKK